MATETRNSRHYEQRSNSMSSILQGTQPLQKNSQFDATKHQPPRIDFFGYNKDTSIRKPGDDGTNILVQSIKIPEWWSKPGIKEEERKTLTKLLEQRRADKIPHSSYDLDGDGFVGGRDYVIAKQFDKDKDGKLNEQEKANALEAVKNGFEKNFIWNVEVSGGQRPYRLLQKRGVIVDAEDYLPVRSTYPAYPDSDFKPKAKDKKELDEMRKRDYRASIDQQKRIWEQNNPQSIEMPFVVSEFLIEQPQYHSINQKKDEKLVNARTKAGLDPQWRDIQERKSPGMEWVDKPKAPTKTLLDAQRKEETLTQLKKIEKNIGQHKDVKARIDERENCHLRLGYKPNTTDYPSKAKIDAERKKKMVENMTQKFGNVTVGIHGQELPKFNEEITTQEWWKLRKNFNMDPSNKSALELKETQKFWAKNDEVLLQDVRVEPAPIDPFKVEHYPQVYKDTVTDKVPHITHWPHLTEEEMRQVEFQRGHQRTVKWTEMEKYQRCQGEKRLFDKIVDEANAYEENLIKTQKDREQHLAQQAAQKVSQKGGFNDGNIESSRLINQSYNKGSNDQEGKNLDSSIKTANKRNEITIEQSNMSPNITKQLQQQNNTSFMQPSLFMNLQNTSGLSMAGKSTLFSRVALSQPNEKVQKPIPVTKGKDAGNLSNTQGQQSTMMNTTANQNSVTLNNQSVVNTNVGKTVLRNSTSSFREAAQRGVVSGIGFLKK